MESVLYPVAAAVIFVAGYFAREAVQWARGELAFSRAVRGQLDEFAARFRADTGQQLGLIEDVPPGMVSPFWLRTPQDLPGQVGQAPIDDDPYPWDDDDYPRDEARVTRGPWRRETTSVPVNGAKPGLHRADLLEQDTQVWTVEEIAAALAEDRS